jgi:hypothetical protein
MQKALVLQGLFSVYNRFESFVFDLQEFGGVVRFCRRLRRYSRDRFTLVADFRNRQWVVFNLGEGIGADLDEGLG